MSVSEPRLVVFSPYGRRAGSSRVRVYEWIDLLGIDATVHAFTDEHEAGFRQIARHPLRSLQRHRQLAATEIGPCEIVMIHRELSPFSNGRAEERLLRAGAHGILDLDDGLQWDWGQGGRARRFQPKSPKILRMARAADLVIAGNDLIAEWAAQHARKVLVIPSCVDPSQYRQKDNYDLLEQPFIGWIGSGATEKHLMGWTDLLKEVNRETCARLVVLGASSSRQSGLDEMIDRTSWTESGSYRLPSYWDVGIMPLPDGLMERSKCAYKLLQYGAAHLPAVASGVGVNTEICPTDFTRSDITPLLGLLQASPETRRRVAQDLASVVSTEYSFVANEQRYRSAVFGFDKEERLDGTEGGVRA